MMWKNNFYPIQLNLSIEGTRLDSTIHILTRGEERRGEEDKRVLARLMGFNGEEGLTLTLTPCLRLV
jgi:hypothetical protein